MESMMRRVTPRFAAFLTADILLLIICLIHLPSVFYRPNVPFDVIKSDGYVVVAALTDTSSSGILHPGDILLKWNSLDIPLPEALEFLADLDSIGSTVSIKFERPHERPGLAGAGGEQSTVVTLIPYYPSPRFLIISLIAGIIIWCTGVFILWNAPPDLNATVLHWTMIAFGVTILITLGPVADNWMSYVTRFLFFVSYTGIVALFFFFTFLFPRPRHRNRVLAALLTFLPALILVGGMSVFHLPDIRSRSLEYFLPFQAFFDAFHVSLFVYLGGAVFNIIHSLRKAELREEKKQLQWLVWGLCLGSAPFLFLQILPQLLFSQYLIAEEYATVFFLVIPFSWSMSFLKYRFLDIEVLINRSIVYSLLTFFIIIVFGLVFFLVTTAFGKQVAFGEYLIVAGIALVMAFLFVPVRNRLQDIIDEFRWELSVLYPFAQVKDLVIQYIEIEKNHVLPINTAMIIALQRKYLQTINNFCMQNNLTLKFVDNIHFASERALAVSDPQALAGLVMSVYITNKHLSIIFSMNGKPVSFKIIPLNDASEIPGHIIRAITPGENYNMSRNSLSASFIAGDNLSISIVQTLRDSLDIDFIQFNPFDKIKPEPKLFDNKNYSEHFNSFSPAAGIAFRVA